MRLFRDSHQHDWQTVGSHYVPGVIEEKGSYESGGGPLGITLDNPEEPYILYGFTIVSQRCAACGALDTYRLVGKFEESA